MQLSMMHFPPIHPGIKRLVAGKPAYGAGERLSAWVHGACFDAARPAGTRPSARPYNSPAHGPSRIFPLRPAARCRETRVARRAGALEGLGLDARSDASV